MRRALRPAGRLVEVGLLAATTRGFRARTHLRVASAHRTHSPAGRHLDAVCTRPSATNQARHPGGGHGGPQLDRGVDVDRHEVLDLGHAGTVGARPGHDLFERRPMAGVVDVVEHVEVDGAHRPRPGLGVRRRSGEGEPGRHPALAGGLAVAGVERFAERRRPAADRVDVDPQADGLHRRPAVPAIDVRRSAHERPVPVQNVVRSRSSASVGGRFTAINVRRTTHPPSSPLSAASSEATSWRWRAMASKRIWPRGSTSPRRTRRVAE